MRRPATVSGGLAARLLASLALVVLTGGLAAWLVAGAVGPAIFHQHMAQAGLGQDQTAVVHAEQAFRSSSVLAMTIALTASVLASLIVSIFLTQRIAGSLGTLSAAATRIADGELDSRVTSPRLGAEFDELTEAFNQMATQLEDSETLRRRLLADVAHELRTPVAILVGYLEGLEDGVAELSPETIATLRDQGSRLGRLAQDLAAVTRAEGGQQALNLEVTSADALLTAARDAAAARCAQADIDLRLHVPEGLPHIRVDVDRMAQVLGNLVDNALRHTPRGGQVTLAADQAQRGWVTLSVSDTGEGIDEEHLPHVFERFYRVDTARDRGHGGSGIGLSIVRAIVVAHGGAVRAFSDGLGTGATFEVELPVA
jgi:signal transduction histidine kinase